MSSILTRPRHSPLCVLLNGRIRRSRPFRCRRAIRRLRDAGLEYELIETETPEECRALACRAAAAGRVVLAAGGDGTLHHTVNGVLDSGNADAIVGLLPLGTGNDYARSWLRSRPEAGAAVAAIDSGAVRRVDVGEVDGRYFVNGLGIGFDAEVVRRRAARRIRWRGYLPTIVRTVLGYRAASYEIEWSGGAISGPAFLIAVMNGGSVGGGFRIAPHADPADGAFEVCRIDPIGPASFVRYAHRVRRGTHAGLPMVRTWRAREIRVRSNRTIQYHMDGEYGTWPPETEMCIRMHPRRLCLLA